MFHGGMLMLDLGDTLSVLVVCHAHLEVSVVDLREQRQRDGGGEHGKGGEDEPRPPRAAARPAPPRAPACLQRQVLTQLHDSYDTTAHTNVTKIPPRCSST